MRYRELVTIEEPTELRSAKGAVALEYAPVDGLTDVPATIVPTVGETRGAEMTPITDRYNIVLAGRHAQVAPPMAVVARDRRFEIESVDPLLSERQTRVVARLVRSPAAEIEGS